MLFNKLLLLCALPAALAKFWSAVDDKWLSCGLPGAIPDEYAQDLSWKGQQFPLAIMGLGWPSGWITAYMYAILASEKLGLNVTMPDSLSTSSHTWFALTGCTDYKMGDIAKAQCPDPSVDHFNSPTHILLEIWTGNIHHFKSLAAVYGDRASKLIGKMGYDGIEATYISTEIKNAGLADGGYSLEWYRQLDGTHFNPGKYFTSITDIPAEQIKPCTEEGISFNNPKNIELVKKYTPDPGGFELRDGVEVAICEATNRWVLTPACRKRPVNECVPWISGGNGWMMTGAWQKAIHFNIPMAIGVASSWSNYKQVPLDHKVAHYWWWPDTAFLSIDPHQVIFPKHDPKQHFDGYKVTEGVSVDLHKEVHYGFKEMSEKAYSMGEKVQFTPTEIVALLNGYLEYAKVNADATYFDFTCHWLKQNMDFWNPWIPDETRCSEGQGLINKDGEFVNNRSLASSCQWCASGRYGVDLVDENGKTSMCVECPAGTSQPFPAMTQCDSCEAGKFNANTGQRVCTPCSPGMAQDMTGATKCDPCAPGSAAPNEGTSTCTLCELGSAIPLEGSMVCITCLLGYYSDELGQSECDWCAANKKDPDTWTTFKRVRDKTGGLMWVYTEGADSISSCGCDEGYQTHVEDDEAQCVSCGTGLICSGMGEVEIAPGYSWDKHLSVHRCYGDLKRCPGGAKGVCAKGRDPESLACTDCLEGMAPSDDGSCVECDGSDTLPFTIFTFIVPCLIVALYFIMDRMADTRIKSGTPHLLIMCSLTMFTTLIQQLMVIGMVPIEWSYPLKHIFDLFQILIFDIDILNLGCIARFDATGRYTMRMFLLVATICFLYFIHICATVFVWKGGLSQNQYRFIRCVGTLVAAFYISVVSSIMMPFSCVGHPNGDETLVSDSSVLCWEGGHHCFEDKNRSGLCAHYYMMGVGLLFSGIPLFFLGLVYYVVTAFPKKMDKGDMRFLQSWNFLFQRFTVQSYWYPLWMMTRNTLITLAPILPGPVSQILALAIIMLISQAITIINLPWRVKNANILDIFCHSAVILVLLLCSFFVKGEEDDVISQLAFTFIVASLAISFSAIGYGIYKKMQSKNKEFQYFVCHHKAGAGAFARLVKVYLLKQKSVTRKVFMDSDDLQDLDLLFGYVGSHSEHFLVVVSAEIFKRCWCIGEMITAHVNKVNTIPLIIPGGAMPDREFIANYETYVPDINRIWKFGMNIEMVQAALENFWTVENKAVYAGKLSEPAMEIVATNICTGGKEQATAIAPTNRLSETAILVDYENTEAMATAIFLKETIKPLIVHETAKIPVIMSEGFKLASTTKDVMMILTNGLFEQKDVLQALMDASCIEATILPILTDENFRFPSPEMANSPAVAMFGKKQSEALFEIIQKCFSEIAIVFQPQLYSTTELVISVKAKEVVARLMKSNRTRLPKMSILNTTTEQETVLKVVNTDLVKNAGMTHVDDVPKKDQTTPAPPALVQPGAPDASPRIIKGSEPALPGMLPDN